MHASVVDALVNAMSAPRAAACAAAATAAAAAVAVAAAIAGRGAVASALFFADTSTDARCEDDEKPHRHTFA